MICQNCGKKDANIRYTQIVNGVKKEINVCENCAKELGLENLDFNMSVHFSDFLDEFINDYSTGLLPSFMQGRSNGCDKCGMDYSEFVKTGLLGCKNDYEIYRDRLDAILKKLHGNNRHIGRKAYCNTDKFDFNKIEDKVIQKNEINNEVKEESKLEILEEKLKKAIKDERYEDAAKIRDEIKELNKN